MCRGQLLLPQCGHRLQCQDRATHLNSDPGRSPFDHCLDRPVTDAIEAAALTFSVHFIDFCVCTRGPWDVPTVMDGQPDREGPAATGSHEGRGGMASVIVWAAGLTVDCSSCDGYVNFIYNIAVGAVTQIRGPRLLWHGLPWGYGCHSDWEPVRGASLSVTSQCQRKEKQCCRKKRPSEEKKVARCNPALTWRDVQYLNPNTAKTPDPKVEHQEQGTISTTGG